MRKIISIPVIILILFSGITVNLASHYCGGLLAQRKLTLAGTPASCGMESDGQPVQTGMKSLCCEDSFSSYTFNNIYVPSSGTKDDISSHEIPVQEVISALIPDLKFASSCSQVPSGPPGAFSPSEVELVSICIFRI